MKYKILSLFANVGVAETYLKENGFKTVIYNELILERANFYHHLHPDVTQIIGDICDKKIQKKIIDMSLDQNIDIIMATPPCQGFSVAGKRYENDPRNKLIFEAISIIRKIMPKYVFIENVVQYFSDKVEYKNKKVKIPDAIKNEFSDNYAFESKILDSKDYGVPQTRKRGFILLSRKDQKIWKFPNPQEQKITVRDAIGHLPSLMPNISGININKRGEEKILNHFAPTHNTRHILAMENTPSGKSAHNNKIFYPKTIHGKKIKGFGTTYKRIEWDKPAPTITMMNGSISSQNNVHPGRLKKDGTYSDPRVLTLREIFILSSLPPNWNYPKWASTNLIRHVVGEGIPPKMVLEIFKMI